MKSLFHPILWYRRRQWRKKVSDLPWGLWSSFRFFEGDSSYFSQGYATDEEYLQALEALAERSEQVEDILERWGIL